MRGGGDGWGVSALEPHLVAHSNNNDQQPGRATRRSARTQSLLAAAAAANGSHHRVDSHHQSHNNNINNNNSNARAAEAPVRNGYVTSNGAYVGNGASSPPSSTDREESGITMIGQGDESGVRATTRGGDGVGLSALDTHPEQSTSKEFRRPPRRSVRRESSSSLPSSSNGHNRVESSMKKGGGEGPVRNGFPGNGVASSSFMGPEPAAPRAQRASAGVATRDRSSKKARGARVNGVEANGLANGLHENNNLVGQKHGKSTANVVVVEKVETVENQAAAAEGPQRERLGEYLPPINDELGLQCLSRLPRYRISELALVCRKWREYLSSPELYKERRLHGVREDWVFILGNNHDRNWRAFLPEIDRWVKLPSCPSDYTFDSCDKESMVAGLNLLVLGQNKDGYVIWKFDTIKSRWSTTPRMNTDRCMFGSATFGKYAYFAGGTSRGTVLRSVERYDSETNSWESVAEMNHERKACSGFVMDGKFHVIGGLIQNNIVTSGEAYDPQTGTWTVIEGMWPQEFVPSTQVSPPLVAVLNNQLYAINIALNILMLYNKEINRWQMLEKVPFRAENNNGWGLGFKAVGDELFVIGGARGGDEVVAAGVARASAQFLPKIHAFKPRVDGGETWRFVTDLNLPTNGFIYNCAVMSG